MANYAHYKITQMTKVGLGPDSVPSRIVEMEHCLQEISQWMATNRLKLNPDKLNSSGLVLVINSINCLHRVLLLLALLQLNG